MRDITARKFEIQIEVGQVWSSKTYYKVVTRVGRRDLDYEFYNKKQFYFVRGRSPSRRRKLIEGPQPTAIEVAESLTKFVTSISIERLTLVDDYFNKKPRIGVDKYTG